MSGEATPARVDFYVLESAEARTRLGYACRLIEKAYLSDQTVYVHVDDAAEAQAFDDLLWTFADRSFVPHALAGAAGDVPVRIGHGEPAPAKVLVQLAAETPPFALEYPRVAEFVDADPARRDQGRRRFAWYRERGATPETHRVGDSARA